MPKDPHAQKMAFERGLMDATGLTRNQVRANLREASTQLEARAQQQRQEVVPSPVSQRLPPLPGVPQSFSPRPFRDAPQNTGSNVDSTSSDLGVIEDIIIVYNGTAYYNTLNGVVGAAV